MGHKWYSLPLLILLCKLFDSFRSRIPVNVEHWSPPLQGLAPPARRPRAAGAPWEARARAARVQTAGEDLVWWWWWWWWCAHQLRITSGRLPLIGGSTSIYLLTIPERSRTRRAIYTKHADTTLKHPLLPLFLWSSPLDSTLHHVGGARSPVPRGRPCGRVQGQAGSAARLVKQPARLGEGLLVVDRFSRKLERPRKPLSRRGALVELQVTLAQHEPGKGQDSVGGRFASAYHWGAHERG